MEEFQDPFGERVVGQHDRQLRRVPPLRGQRVGQPLVPARSERVDGGVAEQGVGGVDRHTVGQRELHLDHPAQRVEVRPGPRLPLGHGQLGRHRAILPEETDLSGRRR
ncbi:hypothetical protein GCM10023328_25030 [Modestobacter marinus]|uniref:Uncharacterized protein n=1 Tax=Modestobacter marinus TaxID=477641 RepID=A0ABQ2FX49_9ACTN|nr:hypothetical protein GCM10011589_17850 [Modestobacter marinus]